VTNDEQIWEEAVEASEGQEDGAEPTLTLEEQLAEAQAEAARNLDGWQRTQAEFANARKRFEKQRGDIYTNANIEVVGKILPLIDDFERALDSVPTDVQESPWVSGMTLVYRKMLAILEEMNVQPIPTVGQPFDPNLHEALSQEPSDNYDSGTIIREMRRGYRLGDRIVRPSLVAVAS
jgi:molecular chaperone GrpE